MLIRGITAGQKNELTVGVLKGRRVLNRQCRDVRRVPFEELKTLINIDLPYVYEDTMLDSAARALVIYAEVVKKYRFQDVLPRFKEDIEYLETQGVPLVATFEVLNNHTFYHHKKGDKSSTIVSLLRMEKFHFPNIRVVFVDGVNIPVSLFLSRMIPY